MLSRDRLVCGPETNLGDELGPARILRVEECAASSQTCNSLLCSLVPLRETDGRNCPQRRKPVRTIAPGPLRLAGQEKCVRVNAGWRGTDASRHGHCRSLRAGGSEPFAVAQPFQRGYTIGCLLLTAAC